MAPRANWEVGKAPLNIGRPPTAYDTHGCHSPERLLLQEWRDYLDTHTVGQLDRKWDRAMREQVSEKMTAFLGSTQKRSELSTGIAYMSAEERTIKTRVESLKQAERGFAAKYSHKWTLPHLSVHLHPMAKMMQTITATMVTQEDADAVCDALKAMCRLRLLEKRVTECKRERVEQTNEFKIHHADVKTQKDDIIYLVAKMRECREEMEDEDYELPAFDHVMLGLPSHNRLRRRDTMPERSAVDSSVSSSATSSSAGFSTTRSRSSEDDGDDDERPAKRMTRSTSAESEESAESAAVESEESAAAAAAAAAAPGTSWF
jgi:hypothetical protein